MSAENKDASPGPDNGAQAKQQQQQQPSPSPSLEDKTNASIAIAESMLQWVNYVVNGMYITALFLMIMFLCLCIL